MNSSHTALLALVQQPEKCDRLIRALDKIAMDFDAREYGLPTHPSAMAQLREAIYRWAAEEAQSDEKDVTP